MKEGYRMQFKILEQLVHDRDKCLNEIKENNKKEREEIKRVTKAVNDKYLKLNSRSSPNEQDSGNLM